MKTTAIELLSPAKDLEVGLAAINHGADAVYIGGPAFGAREKAGNSIEDIEKLCRHAAQFDAKVYVTLNTLLFDNEKEQARQLAWDCWNAGVDALIVQDLSLLELDLPPIPLHASTQCDNLTLERVQEMERLGFEQVVLGRELTIDQIREIRQHTTVPLEFFVHGSLCVSHSGQCYLSQYIGNRSANRGACAQPCRLPWDLLDADGKVLIKGRHLLCLKDLNNSAHLEELLDAGITSFKIEGRLKEADYVKNITALYRQKLDAIFERRSEFVQASQGHCISLKGASAIKNNYDFEVNPEKSFNRGFTDYFIHGRQPGLGSPFTPKSMGEYIGEVKWCNSMQMEIVTDKTLHNGDGLCFLNENYELVGIRADVVRPNRDSVYTVSTVSADSTIPAASTVVCNRPHGAQRGFKIYRNYDIEWQRQVDASTGNRKIDIELVLSETPDGFELRDERLELRDERLEVRGERLEVRGNKEGPHLSPLNSHLSTPKIPATNPEKALENIRKKLSQWGDTIYNPINIEINISQPYLIPASVLGELKRGLLQQMATTGTSLRAENSEAKQSNLNSTCSGQIGLLRCARNDEPDAVPSYLMTCHHCIRYANGLCPKETGKPVGSLFIRNGANTFRLEFDCKKCLMYVCPLE